MPLDHFTHKGRIFMTEDFGYLYLPFHGMMIPLPYDEAIFLKRCETQSPESLIESAVYTEGEAQAFNAYLSRIQAEKNCFNYRYNEKYYIRDFQNIDILFNFVLGCDGVKSLDATSKQFIRQLIPSKAYKANAIHFTLLGGVSVVQKEIRNSLDELSAEIEKPFIYSSSELELKRQGTYYLPLAPKSDRYDDEAVQYDLLESFLAGLQTGVEVEAVDIPEDIGARLDATLPAFKGTAVTNPHRFKRVLRAVFQFVKNQKRLFNCAAAINSIYCDLASGKIHGCKYDATGIGTLSEGLNASGRKAYFNNSIMKKDECLECWCRYFCAGGCSLNTAPPDCDTIRTVYDQIGLLSFKLRENDQQLLTPSVYGAIQSHHECLLTFYYDSCIMDKTPEIRGELS